MAIGTSSGKYYENEFDYGLQTVADTHTDEVEQGKIKLKELFEQADKGVIHDLEKNPESDIPGYLPRPDVIPNPYGKGFDGESNLYRGPYRGEPTPLHQSPFPHTHSYEAEIEPTQIGTGKGPRSPLEGFSMILPDPNAIAGGASGSSVVPFRNKPANENIRKSYDPEFKSSNIEARKENIAAGIREGALTPEGQLKTTPYQDAVLNQKWNQMQREVDRTMKESQPEVPRLYPNREPGPRDNSFAVIRDKPADITSLKDIREKFSYLDTSGSRKSWTESEIGRATKMKEEGKTLDAIRLALKSKHSITAINDLLGKFGLVKPQAPTLRDE